MEERGRETLREGEKDREGDWMKDRKREGERKKKERES